MPCLKLLADLRTVDYLLRAAVELDMKVADLDKSANVAYSSLALSYEAI